MSDKQVCRKSRQSKAKLSTALGAAWSRVSNVVGRGKFADELDADQATVNRAISGPSLPSGEHIFNCLYVDPTALNEVLALYGLTAKPLTFEAANDMQTIADLSHLTGSLAEVLRDGVRKPSETCDLADAIRPLILELSAIVAEADRHRGVAA